MINALEVKNIKFSNAMGGYKKEEVDVFLDKVESDFLAFERTIKEFQTKVQALEEENNQLKAAQSSIQSVLLSAQGLADNIVNEAKEKSEEIIRNAERNIVAITAKEKELSETFENKAQERKLALEKELSEMINEAQLKAESIKKASEDSVARQQMLYDKLKLEIAAFKSSINAKYREHLEILSHVPDSVPNDPEYLSKIISTDFDKAPTPIEFVSKSPAFEPSTEIEDTEENIEEESEGFKVEEI